ncbi:MAG: hypothetical protein WC600_06695 [Desulfobaccales bacterium]
MAKRRTSTAISGEPLSQAEIEAFVAAWYRKLDIHAPWEELQSMVAEQGLEMQFPEGSISGVAAFRNWYEGVIRIFFDEVHIVTRVSTTWEAGKAVVDVVVNWQARRWRPAAPRSEWLGFDAYQLWDMIRSPSSGQPVIRRYVVQELRPMPGSIPL